MVFNHLCVDISWFMTLFASMETLSYDVIVRVFDGFIAVGWKQIFRVALVILETLQVSDFGFKDGGISHSIVKTERKETPIVAAPNSRKLV